MELQSQTTEQIQNQQQSDCQIKNTDEQFLELLLLNDVEKYYFQQLFENQVCLRCIFRIFKLLDHKYYKKENLTQKGDLIKLLDEKIFHNDLNLIFNYDQENIIKSNSHFNKTCLTCYGVLQQADQQEFLDELVKRIQKQDYEFTSFRIRIIHPKSCMIRAAQITYQIENQILNNTTIDGYQNAAKILEKYIVNTKAQTISISQIFRNLVSAQLEKIFDAKYDQNLGALDIGICFENQNEELVYFQQFDSLFKKNKQNQYGDLKKKLKINEDEEKILEQNTYNINSQHTNTKIRVEPTQNNLNFILSSSKQVFLNVCLSNQPAQLLKYDTSVRVEVKHDSVILKGMYCKYSRYLPQTEWYGIETSVGQEIEKCVRPYFQNNKYNVIGGGREDIDVRMLGEGRPFIIELYDPKKSVSSLKDPNILKEIESKINENQKLKISHLSYGGKEALQMIQNSQEEKIKAYACFVEFEQDINDQLFEKLNDIKNLELKQKTPLRVLHRRSPMVRDKMIHALKAYKIDNRHAIMYVLGSAGTYIKEFVHGDLERTIPNIGILTQNRCDIFQLDVIGLYQQIDDQNLNQFYEMAENKLFK